MNKIGVAIFVYNRPGHTKNLFSNLLKKNKLKNFIFYIFSDFVKNPKNSSELKKVLEVRKIVHSYKKKLKLQIFCNNQNKGLYCNIVDGVTYVLKKHSEAIILEDDLILHKSFFLFMKKALKKYKNSNDIFQISGYSYPIKNNRFHYFLSLTSCWGWGITRRNWNNFLKFSKNKRLLKKSFKELAQSKIAKSRFNYNNSYNYFMMLKKHLNNEVNSWGIIFYLYLFLNQKLTLFPNVSLVKNEGFDGTGNHKSKNNLFNSNFKNINIENFPKKIIEQIAHKRKIEFFFKKKLTLYAKIKNNIYEKFF